MSDLWPGLHKPKPAPDPLDIIEWEDEVRGQLCDLCDDDSAIETVGAEVVCTRCGSVLDVPLEWSAEYRWYPSDSTGADPSRCGFPVNHLMPESSLGTIFLNARSPVMRRVARYHSWNIRPYRERTLWSIFDGLSVRASNAGIGMAPIEEAKELFAQLTATDSCRGQTQRDAMLAACLWEALKRHDSPRVPKDMADIFQIPIRDVTRGIKQFQHVLAMRTSGQLTGTYANPTAKAPVEEKPTEESPEVLMARAMTRRAIWQKTASPTTSYENFIKPFLTNLSASNTPALEDLVRHVCARAEDLNIVPENTPPSLTASVIAFCCDHLGIKMDNADIARICGISPVTIQKCLKRMQPSKEKLLAE
jgi:transcription initiation factor TFIIB